MKLKQLVTGGALAATVLTLGSAQAERNPYEGIVFCKATITKELGNEEDDVSVTLPFTTTGRDGQQYTWWNLGEVAAGGVADSWHSKDGHGRFEALNNGHARVYVYLTSSCYDYYASYWKNLGYGDMTVNPVHNSNGYMPEEIFQNEPRIEMSPSPSLQCWRRFGTVCQNSSNQGEFYGGSNSDSWEYRNYELYCLAFTKDVMAAVPTWKMLNHYYDDGECSWRESDDTVIRPDTAYIGAYLGYLIPGDTLRFDVKFWAPQMRNCGPGGRDNAHFTFKVEAASFPLWEHDLDVQ